jgi:histidinol-phosphate aminotransferase
MNRAAGGTPAAIDLSANENPLGPSPRAVEAVARCLGSIHRYPDDTATELKAALAARLGVGPQNVILSNGASQVLGFAAQACLRQGDEAVLASPSFMPYHSVVERCHGTRVVVPLKDYRHDLDAMADRLSGKTRLVFLGNPNNPTGTTIGRDALERFLSRVPAEVLVVLDEAYYEYVERDDFPSSLDYVAQGRRVLVTRSFSKAYGLAGLRIGYGFASPAVIQALEAVRPRYNTNRLAQVAALAALGDDAHVRRTIALNAEGRATLGEQFSRLGLFWVPSEANFLLLEVGDGRKVYCLLKESGVLVQPMDRYGLAAFVRVSVGLAEENERFVRALRTLGLGRAS